MTKGDFKLAWKKYGFTKDTIQLCKTMSVKHTDEKSKDYWERCASFVDSLQYIHYGALSTKQRNWAFNVRRDLSDASF